jgi:pimeloyl-ACP methyl ester carboxylesterase
VPTAATDFVELEVPGHQPALVSVPEDRKRARPLVVAAHGAGDRAEPFCAAWRAIVGARAFVLCPRGTPLASAKGGDDGYYFRDHHALGREVLDAIDALRARFDRELDRGPAVYVGFSQGATMGALFASAHPEIFPRMVLVEGGHGDEWSLATARRFREGGGARVLYACGQAGCRDGARTMMAWLDRAGVATRLVFAPVGHAFAGALLDDVRASFAWLVEGDPRFDAP